MSLIYMEQIRAYPYMSKKRLAEEFDQGIRTVTRRVEGIAKEIESGRYNRYAILESGGKVRVNTYVYADYEKYWKSLQDKNARKYVPEFNPAELAEICGFNQKAVVVEEGA